MKKGLFILAAAVLLFGFIIEEKRFNVTLSQQDWSNRYVWIKTSQAQLKRSNLPVSEILPLCDSLEKFANELAVQLQPQFLQQAKQDSINSSKPKK